MEEKDISEMTTIELIDAYAKIYCSSTADKGFSRSEKYKLKMLYAAIADRCNKEGMSPEGIVLASLLIAASEATEYEFSEGSILISMIRKIGYRKSKRWIKTLAREMVLENA